MSSTLEPAFQDYYPDDCAVCYGCGRLNTAGLHLKSHWEGDIAIARYTPHPEHCAVPGYVYGGLLASLIDCHGTGTAAANAYRIAGRAMNTLPPIRYVTAQLVVNYRKPTPLGPELVLRGIVGKPRGHMTVVLIELFARDECCVTGEVLAAPLPQRMREAHQPSSEPLQP
jgi:acyl-coenzyme A thioesterase PaaI-like protein